KKPTAALGGSGGSGTGGEKEGSGFSVYLPWLVISGMLLLLLFIGLFSRAAKQESGLHALAAIDTQGRIASNPPRHRLAADALRRCRDTAFDPAHFTFLPSSLPPIEPAVHPRLHLARKHIHFAGDSTLRAVFWEAVDSVAA